MELERFGPYRIEAVLGRGGTGELYRAVDTGHDRVVALEVLSEALAADTGYRERFRREADLAAGLDQPHVVPIRRHGEIDGRLFVETPLVPGRDVAAVLADEGPMDPARAVSIVSQTARALDAASAAGLTPHAVSPADVLLTGTGDDEVVAVTGLGVPAESPPGEAQEGRPDVRALAALLSACLTGQLPSPGSPPQPPSALRPELPAALDDVVRRGLAPDAGDRFESCGELAEAGAAALAGPVPDGGGRPHRLPLVVGGIAVVVALAVVLVLVLAGGSSAGNDEAGRTAPSTAQPVTTSPSEPTDDAAQARLRAIIPGDFVNVECDPGEDPGDGALAALGCGSSTGQPGPEDSVFYLYADAATADAAFLADMQRNGVTPLADDDECPAAQGYGPYDDHDHDHTGRLACYITADNDAILTWTQDDVGAEAWVKIIDGGQVGLEALYAWWAFPDSDTSGFVPH